MSLLEEWRERAYDENANKADLERLWKNYFAKEKDFYSSILQKPSDVVEGSVQDLADRFGVELLYMVGILDGINDSLKEPNPIDTMEADTVVRLPIDTEKLYMNMVDARADWLYNLPQWNDIYPAEHRKALYLKQKKSGTVVKGKKIGRNAPCPCGSGKKYKHCCGK